MKSSIKQKLVYRFERFLNKGGSSIFKSLLVIFISGFLFILLLRYLLLLFFPDLDHRGSFFEHVWVTFLEITAPGNMNQDTTSPTWMKLITIIAGFTGVIIFSMLIAFITSSLNSFLHNFRKGRGRVLEEEHSVILGWNDRVVDVIRELILANESEKRGVVVILAEKDKEEMDDFIAKRIPETLTTEIITTSGNPSNINELERISVHTSRSVIILSKCSENAPHDEKIESDVQAIKSIMAINANREEDSDTPVIAEIFTEEKRQIVNYFGDENIICIDSWNIMGKLLMQTSLTSGLQLVYNEMLSFDGGEVYYYQADWGKVNFFDLAFHFEDGIPLGIYNEEEGLILRPDRKRLMKKEDEILIFAEDDSTINYQSEALYKPNKLSLSGNRLNQKKKKTLILGWHNVGEIYISEADEYLLEGSVFDIVFHNPTSELKSLLKDLSDQFSNLEINLIDKNPLKHEQLSSLNPDEYDAIIILSQHPGEHTADKVDSDTIILLLLLREIINEDKHPKLITQVLNSENQQLINQTEVDDFIISNKLITMILAQLSEDPKIKMFYDDIFSEDGSEIYVKPCNLYFTEFPQKITFADAMGIANDRDEICLGIRKGNLVKDIKQNFGVSLNLNKDQEIILEENDFLVVLSEDEL